jgi:four helix bundle protein
MTEHKDLIIWQKAMVLIVDVYKLTNKLPASEKYGLTDQLRRASVSIASNIAEGCKRSTDKDFKSFLHTALGSLAETETQLLVCKNLGLLSEADIKEALQQIVELNKMLISFIKRLS